MFDVFDDGLFDDDEMVAHGSHLGPVNTELLSGQGNAIVGRPDGVAHQTLGSSEVVHGNGSTQRQSDKRSCSPDTLTREPKRPVVAPLSATAVETLAKLDRAFAAVATTSNVAFSRPSEVISTVPSEFVFDDDDEDFAGIDLGMCSNANTNADNTEQQRESVETSGGINCVALPKILNYGSRIVCPSGSPSKSVHSSTAQVLPGSAKIRERVSSTPEVTGKTKLLQRTRDPFSDEWKSHCKNEAWQTLERDLLASTSTGALNMFSVATVLRKANKDTLPNRIVHLLFVLLDSISDSPRDVSAFFVDPTGKMSGIIHRDLIKEYPTQMRPGSVFVLGQVTVFRPSQKSYCLNITAKNILHMYWIQDQNRVEHKQFVKSSLGELIAEAKCSAARRPVAPNAVNACFTAPARPPQPCIINNDVNKTPAGSKAPVRLGFTKTDFTPSSSLVPSHEGVQQEAFVTSKSSHKSTAYHRPESKDPNRPSTLTAAIQKLAAFARPASPAEAPNIDDIWMDDDLDDVFANIDC